MAPSKTALKKLTKEELMDHCRGQEVDDSGTKNDMLIRLYDHYGMENSQGSHDRSPSVVEEPTPDPDSVTILGETLQLAEQSVNEILNAGFATVKKLRRLALCQDFPSNLKFITMDADRMEVQLFIGPRQQRANTGDLRSVIDQRKANNTDRAASNSSRNSSRRRYRPSRNQQRSESNTSGDSTNYYEQQFNQPAIPPMPFPLIRFAAAPQPMPRPWMFQQHY
ncbi:uncharacterized protein LOC129602075 [Paramacrobiotus metropolitanus]|uniref:uncharacterized protein LOC129602075 n=1 Tax=Paramacrobiotus metropolitanus TaxID=2943436 RepID=UPI002445A8E3|nr:uncharacterized protein LOC129602075 [Paramacrobiotus metropolitanus]